MQHRKPSFASLSATSFKKHLFLFRNGEVKCSNELRCPTNEWALKSSYVDIEAKYLLVTFRSASDFFGCTCTQISQLAAVIYFTSFGETRFLFFLFRINPPRSQLPFYFFQIIAIARFLTSYKQSN